jgi:hypothetical protein
VEYRNVTLRLPETLVRKFRVYAAERNESMTTLVAGLMEKAVEDDSEKEARIRRSIERMRNATGHGGITWTREELYRY